MFSCCCRKKAGYTEVGDAPPQSYQQTPCVEDIRQSERETTQKEQSVKEDVSPTPSDAVAPTPSESVDIITDEAKGKNTLGI
ncbi:hypothetical protein KIPB_014499 [Kipferlia bialata]|uniref:Uncharacterized protein n=1 Tax=Kipferlia bialata TaxID=797122 RepID=A0A391P2J1_9EUKA|nr:hypothetical protein KIPB_014499 [Kipferlia bialata]|eukprot:g14499.t1